MIRAETPQGTSEYRYDALGRRIAKHTAQGETRFQYDGPRLLAEIDSQRSRTYLFEPGSFRPLVLHEQDNAQSNGTTYHYHLDHLGTPRELTDSDGKIVWSARYRAYGNLALADVEEIDNPLRFQGQYFDAETGLHYNLNRYYDPNAGRFIHQDPIGLKGGANVYRYAPNPMNWIDPLGLTCKATVTRGANNEVLTVKARVTPQDIGTGTGTNASSRASARAMGNATDDAGHTIAKNLGGKGGVGEVFPQDPHINRGQFNQFEGRVADYVQSSGQSVDISQTFNYASGGTRPTSVVYEVFDTSGNKIMSQVFSN